MAPKDDPEYVALQKEIVDLTESLRLKNESYRDKTLEELTSSMCEAPKVRLSTKRDLKGHIHKVNAIDFSGDSRHLVSASLDGKLIVWDSWTANKVKVINLQCPWSGMSVSFSNSGHYLACGGMDNMLTVYDLRNQESASGAKIIHEFAGYDGFLTCCKFLDDSRIITGSGDMKISQWDLEHGKRVVVHQGHTGDVMSLSLCPADKNVFVTGSVDQTDKVWDLREKTFVQSFTGHTGDVNSVFFHPSSLAFVSASDDKSVRLFDLRACQQIGIYKTPDTETSFTSVVLSKSGRIILAGSDDSSIYTFDLLKTTHLGTLIGHEKRITSLAITESILASASWDQHVRIWC